MKSAIICRPSDFTNASTCASTRILVFTETGHVLELCLSCLGRLNPANGRPAWQRPALRQFVS
jgi:hypothetical protein